LQNRDDAAIRGRDERERVSRRIRLRAALRMTLVTALAAAAMLPAAGFAAGREVGGATVLSSACRDGNATDSGGNPCPGAPSRLEQVREAKVAAANAYHRFLTGQGSREDLDRAEYTLSRLSLERIGAHDWSIPANTPASLRLRGETPDPGYGPLNANFFPFEQITSWYCGPATAETILWFLGPHRSESFDEVWGGRPWLTGNPAEDQWLLANDFWLATNAYEGTNWGERYMPFTLNAWRGTFWYVQSESPAIGGDLTKDQALIQLRYDFDHSYPVAENVLYSPATYYPYGFAPGVIYQHWDVLHGYVEDPATGVGYVKVGQVYYDKRYDYQRFQQVAWDVHWGAIANWHGIVW
jgi:hypothetical protein